jgi:nicotinate phosphoribosyltransferase
LLVDTFDPLVGVDRVILLMRESRVDIGGIRIDCEPLLELSLEARRRLDRANLRHVKIFASGGLDEVGIDELLTKGAPIDAFGVGSALVCSTDKPALDIAYKLVDYRARARAKYSAGKATLPGKKQVFRTESPESDVLELRTAQHVDGVPLLQRVWHDGERLYAFEPAAARDRARETLSLLPDAWFLPPGTERPPRPTIGPALTAEAERTRCRIFGEHAK